MEHPLRTFRQRAGLTLADVAGKVATTKQTISRIENGQQNPSLEMIRRLVEASDGTVSAEDFIDAALSGRRSNKAEAEQ